MKLYGGRFLKSSIQKQVISGRELFDGIVISIDDDNKYCMVQIQGTTTQIKAWYPENVESKPTYLKIGNAVRIQKPGGARTRMEVVSCGMFLPTSATGESISVTHPANEDTILTGCNLICAEPNQMIVLIKAGTYRISGNIYTTVGLCMDNEFAEMDIHNLYIDSGDDVIGFDAASSTLFRYDSILIDTDGVITISKGTSFSSTGTIPDPPAASTNQLRLGFVLISPGLTVITPGDINKLFTTPSPIAMNVTVDDRDLAWDELTTNINIGILDQYGNYIASPVDIGWKYTIAWTRGNGSLSFGGVTVSSPTSIEVTQSTASPVSVTYTRNQTEDDESPMFYITESNAKFTAQTKYITLYNESDEAM